MSLNPGGTNYGWNYSKPDKPGYSTQLIGTVLAIQEVQKMGYTMTGQPGQPQFWPDGNPMMNIRIVLCTQDGELKTFTFQPAGKAARMGQKKSVHMDLFHLTTFNVMHHFSALFFHLRLQKTFSSSFPSNI